MYKKLLFLLLIICVSILTALYFIGAGEGTRYERDESSVLASDPDVDNDGLYDWEEELYGTDALNRDTDGDGATDGEEVAEGRDPLLAGPDDFVTGPNVVSQEMSEGEILEMRRQFLNEYLQESADEIQEVTIASLIEGYDQEAFTARYDIRDLNTKAIASTTEIRAYGNTLARTFEKYGYTNRLPEDEFEVFRHALETRDQSDLPKLILIAELYELLAEELLVMEVPFGVAEHHLMFVNGYDVFARALRAMADFFHDPVQGGGGYQAYLVQTAAITAALLNTADYFAKYDILFTSEEPGRMFNIPDDLKAEQNVKETN